MAVHQGDNDFINSLHEGHNEDKWVNPFDTPLEDFSKAIGLEAAIFDHNDLCLGDFRKQAEIKIPFEDIGVFEDVDLLNIFSPNFCLDFIQEKREEDEMKLPEPFMTDDGESLDQDHQDMVTDIFKPQTKLACGSLGKNSNQLEFLLKVMFVYVLANTSTKLHTILKIHSEGNLTFQAGSKF